MNASHTDREVCLAWRPFPGDLYLGMRPLVTGRDTCTLYWRTANGSEVTEAWWLDRGQGLLVCPTPNAWFEANRSLRAWNVSVPSLGARAPGGGFDLAELSSRLDAAADSILSGLSVRDGVDVRELPEPIAKVAAIYPEAKRRSGLEPTVRLHVLVSRTGNVRDVRVGQSVPGFDEAAIAAVRRWHFKPALAANSVVGCWIEVPVRFTLR